MARFEDLFFSCPAIIQLDPSPVQRVISICRNGRELVAKRASLSNAFPPRERRITLGAAPGSRPIPTRFYLLREADRGEPVRIDSPDASDT